MSHILTIRKDVNDVYCICNREMGFKWVETFKTHQEALEYAISNGYKKEEIRIIISGRL